MILGEKQLFLNWLHRTQELQKDYYGVDYELFHGDSDESLRAVIEYLRWNMLAIDDELAEARKAISWKPWQSDKPYVDRKEVIKECVDILHFVANIICAVGGTDRALDEMYVEKMEINRNRQRTGYVVRAEGVKCDKCARALDDYDVSSCREDACPQKEPNNE